MLIVKDGGHRVFEKDPATAATVSEMLIELESHGMDAVRRYSEKLDGWAPRSFELDAGDIRDAILTVDAQVIEDTRYCQQNVRSFAQAQFNTMGSLEVQVRPGVVLGHKHLPMQSVGSYIPGGRYPMFGSAQMSIIPAKVAGVDSVVACTPPNRGQGPFAPTINAIHEAGADRIFVVGGVQALAMMAFGLEGIKPVDMLCGAGNKYVAEAKRQLFGRCGIDLLAGPTEIMVIADDNADPDLAACDLLGQAEHDPGSGSVLICFSETFARECIDHLKKRLAVLPTRDVASQSWRDYGRVVVADDVDEAIALSDDYAPEHLELHLTDAKTMVDRLRNYGSLFIGPETTVAYGDKCIGTNHILPTSRSARYTGGVWVGKFLKTVTYQHMTEEGSREIGAVTARQCRAEHMIGHAITAEERVSRYAKPNTKTVFA
jgi:sulfopropanediol 3-dehydrogenase